MANLSACHVFIPFNRCTEAFPTSNCENSSHLRNINNVSAFESNRLKRRRRDSECGGSSKKSVPWKKRDRYSRGVVGLHEEINDFYDAMLPTSEEKELRQIVVSHIRHTVTSLWPQAKVEVFGSFNTGLYLPTSDIDIVVTGKWDNLPLNTLRTALVKSGIDDSDIYVLSNAAVPLVRLMHTHSKVKVDISFNVSNGIRSADFIKESINKFPVLPKIVLVLKQFLLHRNLNEVFSGGMSSYALTLLVISYLQGIHKPNVLAVTNLGTLLIEFFELYGINFNYERVSICVQGTGKYIPKQNQWSSYLSIKDPHCETNDIAKGTYLMQNIKEAFENAYNTLHKAVTEPPSITRTQESLLELILDIDGNVFVQRQWIKDNFDVILKSFPYHNRKLFKDKSWPGNAQESTATIPAVKKEAVPVNLPLRSKEPFQEDRRRPLQKTLVFYCSRNNNARNAEPGQNCYPQASRSGRFRNWSDGRVGPNPGDYNKKNFRPGRYRFQEETDNYGR